MALNQCVIIPLEQMTAWQYLSRDLALQHQQLQLLQVYSSFFKKTSMCLCFADNFFSSEHTFVGLIIG
jgi:hypothetical protein